MATNLLDKEQMLRKLKRMNQRAEQDREHSKHATERKLIELQDQVSAATATMHRLRNDKTSLDYQAAKDTRDTLTIQIKQLSAELNPLTEFERVNDQIEHAKLQGNTKETEQVTSYMATVQKMQQKYHHTSVIYPHPQPWDGDYEAGDILKREIHHLGESDPSLLKLDWTRFDFKPSIPWRDVRQGELTKHSGPGLLTYRTKKTDRLDARVTTSREGTSPILNPRGITSRRSHSRQRDGSLPSSSRVTDSRRNNDTMNNNGNEPLPSSFFNSASPGNNTDERTGFTSNSNNAETSSLLHDNGGSLSSSSTESHRHPYNLPPLPLDTLHSSSNNPLDNNFHNTSSSSTMRRTKHPPVPSATIPRRNVTSIPVPSHLLDTLSPAQKRVPMHPVYQLNSVVQHTAPWRKPERKTQLFSELPRNKAASSNDIARAKTFIVPDRVYYDPKNDGKMPWLKPEENAIPIFSHLPLDAEWLSIFGTVEADELEKRFFSNSSSNDNYEGEDAFNSSSSSPNNNKALSSTGHKGGFLRNDDPRAHTTIVSRSVVERQRTDASRDLANTGKMLMNSSRNSTMSRLSRLGGRGGNTSAAAAAQTLSPGLASRLHYDQRKQELLERHTLGIKAFEAAEKQAQEALVHVTSRMKGKDKGTTHSDNQYIQYT